MQGTRPVAWGPIPYRPDRREALAWLAGMFAALHAEGAHGTPERKPSPASSRGLKRPDERGPRLKRLRLKTHVLGEVRRFYGDAFGLDVVAETKATVAFAAGATRLEFEQVTDGSKPYYHFAFNIPENKIETAKDWLGKRVPILRHAHTGDEIIHFENWNAHSLFFYDPAGSLVELIARHTLPNAARGTFSRRDLLYASEIGIVPPEQEPVIGQIRETFRIAPYLNGPSFLGDEYGIIIVINPDYRWIPRFEKGGILAPAQITLAGHGARKLQFAGLPFEIIGDGT